MGHGNLNVGGAVIRHFAVTVSCILIHGWECIIAILVNAWVFNACINPLRHRPVNDFLAVFPTLRA